MTQPAGYHTWNVLWTVWFCASVGSFLAVETYALVTDWQRTLSAAVWRMEDFLPGQPISKWTAVHLLFIGALVLLDVWLLGHFAAGWWR